MTASGIEDTQMIGMSSPDRCPSCGSEMAPDQRYCVECGNRRGKPRFGNQSPSAAAAAPVAAESAPRRFSSSSTLLLGLAILLLALGTGVLIGNNGGGSQDLANKTPHIVINNGSGVGGTGSSSADTSGGTSSGSAGSGSGSTGKSGSGKSGGTSSSGGSKTASITGKSQSNINVKSLKTKAQKHKALASVTHQTTKLGNGKKIASESTKIGGACAAGTIGCQNGKFTGQYFSSGG